MGSLKWCYKQKDGIKLIEPSDNLAQSYLKLAEKSLGTMNRERNFNLMFAISACYYSMYYSLYAILMKLGVKCGIHSCTLKFMNSLLTDFYSKQDLKTVKKAFDARIIAQYYVDKIVSEEDSNFIISQAPLFFNKSKEILAKINEKYIEGIREKLKSLNENEKTP